MPEKFMDFYTKAEINAMLNGLTFKKISQEDFDALTVKDENTVYYVYDDSGKIVQYFGDAELTSGSITVGNSVPILSGASGFAGESEISEGVS